MPRSKFSLFVSLLLITFYASNVILAINETIPPQMQKLSNKLLGKWKAELFMTMNEKEYLIKDNCEFTQIADGQGIYMSETMMMDNGTEYKIESIIGFDAATETLHWYTVTNMGDTQDNIVNWIDNDTFTITFCGMKNNKPYEEYIECKFIRDGYCDIKQTVKVNKEIVSEIYGAFIRQ